MEATFLSLDQEVTAAFSELGRFLNSIGIVLPWFLCSQNIVENLNLVQDAVGGGFPMSEVYYLVWVVVTARELCCACLHWNLVEIMSIWIIGRAVVKTYTFMYIVVIISLFATLRAVFKCRVVFLNWRMSNCVVRRLLWTWRAVSNVNRVCSCLSIQNTFGLWGVLCAVAPLILEREGTASWTLPLCVSGDGARIGHSCPSLLLNTTAPCIKAGTRL